MIIDEIVLSLNDIEQITLESDLNAIHTLLNSYKKLMYVEQNQSIVQNDIMDLPYYQETSVILESNGSSKPGLIQAALDLIKKIFEWIQNQFRKIFGGGSVEKTEQKIEQNAAAAIAADTTKSNTQQTDENNISNEEKSSGIKDIALKAGCAVVTTTAVGGGIAYLIHKKSNQNNDNNDSSTSTPIMEISLEKTKEQMQSSIKSHEAAVAKRKEIENARLAAEAQAEFEKAQAEERAKIKYYFDPDKTIQIFTSALSILKEYTASMNTNRSIDKQTDSIKNKINECKKDITDILQNKPTTDSLKKVEESISRTNKLIDDIDKIRGNKLKGMINAREIKYNKEATKGNYDKATNEIAYNDSQAELSNIVNDFIVNDLNKFADHIRNVAGAISSISVQLKEFRNDEIPEFALKSGKQMRELFEEYDISELLNNNEIVTRAKELLSKNKKTKDMLNMDNINSLGDDMARNSDNYQRTNSDLITYSIGNNEINDDIDKNAILLLKRLRFNLISANRANNFTKFFEYQKILFEQFFEETEYDSYKIIICNRDDLRSDKPLPINNPKEEDFKHSSFEFIFIRDNKTIQPEEGDLFLHFTPKTFGNDTSLNPTYRDRMNKFLYCSPRVFFFHTKKIPYTALDKIKSFYGKNVYIYQPSGDVKLYIDSETNDQYSGNIREQSLFADEEFKSLLFESVFVPTQSPLPVTLSKSDEEISETGGKYYARNFENIRKNLEKQLVSGVTDEQSFNMNVCGKFEILDFIKRDFDEDVEKDIQDSIRMIRRVYYMSDDVSFPYIISGTLCRNIMSRLITLLRINCIVNMNDDSLFKRRYLLTRIAYPDKFKWFERIMDNIAHDNTITYERAKKFIFTDDIVKSFRYQLDSYVNTLKQICDENGFIYVGDSDTKSFIDRITLTSPDLIDFNNVEKFINDNSIPLVQKICVASNLEIIAYLIDPSSVDFTGQQYFPIKNNLNKATYITPELLKLLAQLLSSNNDNDKQQILSEIDQKYTNEKQMPQVQKLLNLVNINSSNNSTELNHNDNISSNGKEETSEYITESEKSELIEKIKNSKLYQYYMSEQNKDLVKRDKMNELIDKITEQEEDDDEAYMTINDHINKMRLSSSMTQENYDELFKPFLESIGYINIPEIQIGSSIDQHIASIGGKRASSLFELQIPSSENGEPGTIKSIQLYPLMHKKWRVQEKLNSEPEPCVLYGQCIFYKKG